MLYLETTGISNVRKYYVPVTFVVRAQVFYSTTLVTDAVCSIT